ncbi:MAG: flagellar biosynthesis protein [Rubrivivax sp.]|nr:flagellar biosynthesis protein [Rubrivivax sp.]
MNRSHGFSPFDGPADQASGLRRLFGAPRRHLMPVVANPFVPGSQALLQALTAGLVAQGRRVLVVDAAAGSPMPHESALFDLVAGVERLHAQVSYLAARGIPLSHVDTRGSAAAFIDAAWQAEPDADLLLMHAEPTDLARMLARQAVRPVLLACDRPDSVKHAYACCKLLVQRAGVMDFDLVLSARRDNRRAAAIVERLGSCADAFLGATLHAGAVIDPVGDTAASRDAALLNLLAGQLALRDHHRSWAAPDAGPTRMAPASAMPPAVS